MTLAVDAEALGESGDEDGNLPLGRRLGLLVVAGRGTAPAVVNIYSKHSKAEQITATSNICTKMDLTTKLGTGEDDTAVKHETSSRMPYMEKHTAQAA